MSIDPTRLATALGKMPPQKTPSLGVKNGSHDFSKLLDNTVNSLKSNGELQQQAIDSMRLAQLQMLQGLFVADDEPAGNDMFTGIGGANSWQKLTSTQSQIVDKYYVPQSRSVSKIPTLEPLEQMIDRIATEVDLPPVLIHSVVTAESAYNPEAVSSAGAQGLMQLMPETAAELGVDDSFDPQQNVRGGSKYLKQLLDKYDGDLDSALAAYNWGQGNVDRHGLEKMPTETRNYLTKIKGMLDNDLA